MSVRRYKCSKWKRWLVNQQIQQIEYIEDDITKLDRTEKARAHAYVHTRTIYLERSCALQTFEGGEQ